MQNEMRLTTAALAMFTGSEFGPNYQ